MLLVGGLLIAGSLLSWHPETAAANEQPHLQVKSANFTDNGPIPLQYTCDGANLSPHLEWSAVPAGTRSVAIVMNDPDAPVDFTHWVVYNLRPVIQQLVEGASMKPGANFQEGRNSFRQIGYSGPCPPPGKPHHYIFRVYALDIRIALPAGATRQQLEEVLQQHRLAEGRIVGIYQRR